MYLQDFRKCFKFVAHAARTVFIVVDPQLIHTTPKATFHTNTYLPQAVSLLKCVLELAKMVTTVSKQNSRSGERLTSSIIISPDRFRVACGSSLFRTQQVHW